MYDAFILNMQATSERLAVVRTIVANLEANVATLRIARDKEGMYDVIEDGGQTVWYHIESSFDCDKRGKLSLNHLPPDVKGKILEALTGYIETLGKEHATKKTAQTKINNLLIKNSNYPE